MAQLSIGIPDMGSVVIDGLDLFERMHQALRAQRLYPVMKMEPETWAWEWIRGATVIELGDQQWECAMHVFRTDPAFAECLNDPPMLWGKTLVHVPVPSWLMTW